MSIFAKTGHPQISLGLAVLLALLVTATGCSPVSVDNPTGDNPVTPDLQATVEVQVQATLEAFSGIASAETPVPTSNASPLPTSSAKISAVEATERLRIYFEEASERGATMADHKKRIDSGMFHPVPEGCFLPGIFDPDSYEKCPEWVKAMMESTAIEQSKEFSRTSSTMTAVYQGQGTWLITVEGIFTIARIDLQGTSFNEQWWLFESGDTPPRKVTNQ